MSRSRHSEHRRWRRVSRQAANCYQTLARQNRKFLGENLWTSHGATIMNEPAIEELMELARRVPAPPGQNFTGASEAEISGLETGIGRPLSPGLRRWLKVVNGAMLGPGGVFGIRGPRDFLSIEKYLTIYPEWRSFGWVPVASDGVGDYWAAVPQGPDGGTDWVAFVNTEDDPASIDRYVASSVPHFMKFLLESDLGETRWPGDRAYDLEHDPALAAAPEGKAAWSSR